MTLVEVMIASTVAFMVAGTTTAVMITSLRSTTKSMVFHRVNREARYLSDTFSRDVRGAWSVAATYTDGQTTYTTGDDTIVLELPSIDAQGNVIDVDNTHDAVVYHPDGDRDGVLIREVFPDASSNRASDHHIYGNAIGSSAFTGMFASEPNALGAHVIHYQFMVSQTELGVEISMPIAGSVRLRNK